ncbi:MAG: 3-dehydroquinate dehydratase [Bacteroidales bacterium]|jgi:3-dehydroquinate dehydratase-2|nr:3-dehydroquinate dehydratase [Bacteroidales bacterium]
MKHILIINGANLNLLGKRETDIYGNRSFEDYLSELRTIFSDIKISYFQSNIEGEIVNAIQRSEGIDGIVLNAGGYAHTSVVIRDAITSITTPVVEVHISNIMNREEFRHTLILSSVCKGVIFGFGLYSYELAIRAIK